MKTEVELEKFNEEEAGEEIFYLIRKIKKANIVERREKLDQEIAQAESNKSSDLEDLILQKQQLVHEEQEI